MRADVLATQGARALATVILIMVKRDIFGPRTLRVKDIATILIQSTACVHI